MNHEDRLSDKKKTSKRTFIKKTSVQYRSRDHRSVKILYESSVISYEFIKLPVNAKEINTIGHTGLRVNCCHVADIIALDDYR